MPTFQQAFCAAHQCRPAEFTLRVFWRALPPHARLLAPLFGGCGARFFNPDREFITAAGQATSLAQLREEIRDFSLSAENRSWLRKQLRIRVSGRRLKTLARGCLGRPSPAPGH